MKESRSKNPTQPTQSSSCKVADQLRPDTPAGVIEIIETQMKRAAEAAQRIENEGSVVRDMKGSVIPHPAIAIELKASQVVADLLAKHKARGKTR